MTSDHYFYAFKFVSGMLSFTLLTFCFRYFGNNSKLRAEDSTVEGHSWLGPEELEIVDIFQETSDIKTFRLKRKDKSFPLYFPGQFLSFQIGLDEKTYRSYSISCSCENSNLIEVSIKKINDGMGSGWFHSLKIGDKVVAHPPSGLFSDVDQGNSPRVFIGGGIGITPLKSMIETAIDKGLKHSMTLFYAARSKKDLAFHEGLVLLEKRYLNFKYFPILSDEKDQSWQGLSGRLNVDIIKSNVGNLKDSSFYFCGPPAMTESISNGLIESGVSSEQLYSEEFVSPTSISMDEILHREAKITFNGETHNYSGKQNLLDFLESKNQEISFACRSGVCGACKVKKVAGKAMELTDSGLKKEEKGQYILTCVSWPEEDLSIES